MSIECRLQAKIKFYFYNEYVLYIYNYNEYTKIMWNIEKLNTLSRMVARLKRKKGDLG